MTEHNPQSEFEREFGANLRFWRKKKGLTQATLALQMTEIGRPMNNGQVSHLENGTYKSPPSSRDIVAAAYVLGIPPAVLLLPQDTAQIVLAHVNQGIPGVLATAAAMLAQDSSGAQ